MRRSYLLTLGLALSACQPEPEDWRDDYDFVWEGEHVTLYGYERVEEDACGGSFAALDRHSASIIEFFGYDSDLHYDYRWMSHAAWDGRCGPTAGACTAWGEPWTRSVPDMHEAAHAVIYAASGSDCPSLLEEGVAVYLGPPHFHSFWKPAEPEYPVWVDDLLTAAPLPLEHYERAGNFASYLIEAYGPEAVARLCEEVPFYNTLDDWRAAVPEVLGVELEVMLADYEHYPRCHRQQLRGRLWECAGEPDATADPNADVEFELEMDCADERIIGRVGGRMVATRRIAFPEDMRLGVHLRDEDGEDPGLDFNLHECVACSEDPDLHASSELSTVFNFRAGVYELIVFADPGFSQTLNVRLHPI